MKYAAVIASVAAFAKDDYCPSTECYDMSGPWSPDADVSCTFKPSADCMVVECKTDRIQATFKPKLFHTNAENGDSFGKQLIDGHRRIEATSGNGEVLNHNSGPCQFSLVDSDNVYIDWPYSECSDYIDVSQNDDDIIYTVTIEAKGNSGDNGDDVIEFYVDTDVSASCAYPRDIVVNAAGFWINQEDVEAAQNAAGALEPIFGCNFYAEQSRLAENQITADNIVNMGVMIYGQVSSETQLPGLSYELTDVVISNPQSGDTYSPIKNGDADVLVDAAFDAGNSAQTGTDVLFNYLSFGFETDSGTDQNNVQIECKISLTVNA